MDETEPEAGPSLDTVERMLRDDDGAPPVPPALAPGTRVTERYVIESTLGTGGMGTVYRARDQQLGRSVALKLHRTIAQSARLRREAIAMAKLAHPNVVTVFEVGEVGGTDGRGFVAMEFVSGKTLRAWLEEKPRSRREIIEALTAAGAGLAAAHDVGLVHRDVKPDNILVGDDGRVRIGDFGLARLEGTDAQDRAAAPDAAVGDATATGTILGTPAYMAPEQIDGAELDARTDQFALAVVAWEALAGLRPFGGATMSQRRAEIVKGPQQGGRAGKMPVRLRRVLVRALAADPAARWPSVRAMLSALRVAELRPRILAGAAATAVLIGSGTAWAMWPAPDMLAACDAAGGELAVTLPVPRTTALTASIAASGAAHAQDRAWLVDKAIGSLRTRYTAAARTTCRARVEHTWAPALVDASRECLAAQASVARESLFALTVNAGTVPDLVQLAAGLPAFTPCVDANQLAAWRPLATPTVPLADVLDARARLEAALALVELGRLDEASAAQAAVAGTPAAATPAVQPKLALLGVGLDRERGVTTDVEARIRDIYFEARGADDGDTLLHAVYALVLFTGDVQRNVEAAKSWSDHAISDAAREHLRRPDLAARAVAVAAAVAADRGDAERALALVEQARKMITAETPALVRAELEKAHATALKEAGKIDDALAASDRELALLTAALGADHPVVGSAWAARALIYVDAGRTTHAVQAAARARNIVDHEGETDTVSLAKVQIAIGVALLTAAEGPGEAYLQRARATLVDAFGPDHPDVALVDTNLAVVYNDRKDTPRALAVLRHAISIQERTLGPAHVELAVAYFNLAVAERSAGDYTAAAATAAKCEAIIGKRERGSERHATTLAHLAMILNLAGRFAEAREATDRCIEVGGGLTGQGAGWCRLEAARARIRMRDDLAQVPALLARARTLYQKHNMPGRLAEAQKLAIELRQAQ